jgi:hypothetical protein
MRRSKKMLSVVPNPYLVLDHEGRPSCVVRYDPAFGRKGEVTYVGATLAREKISRDDTQGRHDLDDRHALWDITYKYSMTPLSIENTDYHLARIREGSILAADEATAKFAGVEFVDLAKALDMAKAKAVADWKADHEDEDPTEGWPDLSLAVVAMPTVTPTTKTIATVDQPLKNALVKTKTEES